MSAPVISLADARKARERPERTDKPAPRTRRLLTRTDWRKLRNKVWGSTNLLTDAELIWVVGLEHYTPEDTLRLRDLRTAVTKRACAAMEQQFREEERQLAARLKRLSLDPKRLGQYAPGWTS